MTRRGFLAEMAAGIAAASLIRDRDQLWALTQTRSQQKTARRSRRRAMRATPNDNRNRIAISTWSFHNYFQSTRDEDFRQSGKTLALLDFPEMMAERYNVHNLEFVAPHFGSAEPAYLTELRVRLKQARSRLVNIPVDIDEIQRGGGLSDPNKSVRAKAVAAAKGWIEIARQLGARSVRCDPGKMNPAKLAPTIQSYRELSAYGRPKGIYVIIENHGGVGSEHPEELIKLFKGVRSDYVGALPDFGNFPDESTREYGLKLLFPYGHVVCHAKGLEFDSNGNETKFDFRNCVEISKRAGYKGVYSVEYEGPGDPYEGVQKVVDELLRFL